MAYSHSSACIVASVPRKWIILATANSTAAILPMKSLVMSMGYE